MRRASAAVGHRDEVLRGHDHRLRVRARERDIQNVRESPVWITVDDRPQRGQRLESPRTKRAGASGAISILGERQSRRRSEARDEVDRQRARPKAALLAPTEHQRRQRRPLVAATPRDQRADALRPVHLVRRDAQQIDA